MSAHAVVYINYFDNILKIQVVPDADCEKTQLSKQLILHTLSKVQETLEQDRFNAFNADEMFEVIKI